MFVLDFEYDDNDFVDVMMSVWGKQTYISEPLGKLCLILSNIACLVNRGVEAQSDSGVSMCHRKRMEGDHI